MESVHQLMLDDEIPENERARLDPDHWYEINLTNAVLFSNLYLEHVAGLEQLVPGRLFSTRMPRNIVEDLGEREDFIKRCRVNKLRVVFVLTESHEFKKYSGMDGLLEFYKQECGLIVYNRAIPDFQIPTQGDLVNNILDLVYHLSKGRNCLVHCAGGTGRTGMVLAAIVQNLGVYDPVTRIRKVRRRRTSSLCDVTVILTGQEHVCGDQGPGDLPEEHAQGHRQPHCQGEATARQGHRGGASHSGNHNQSVIIDM